MRITRIRAKNWKDFTDLDIPVNRRLFIVGPNATGKSNILDILLFLRDIVRENGGFQGAVNNRGTFGVIRSLYSRKDPRVLIEINLRNGKDGDPHSVDWKYTLEFYQKKGGKTPPVITRETVMRGERALLIRPDSDDKSDEERLTQTALEQIGFNREFRELAHYFANITYFHPVPQLMRNQIADSLSEDSYGSDFLAKIAKLPERTRNTRLRILENALKSAMPQFQSLELVRDEVGKPHLKVGYKNWRRYVSWQRENALSDGTLRLIGLLWALIELPKNKGGVLLLEEPELSLNDQLVEMIPRLLWKAQKDAKASYEQQVFLTTHAPSLFRDESISPREIIVLRPTTNGTSVNTLEQICDNNLVARELNRVDENPIDIVRAILDPAEVPKCPALA